MKKLIVIRHGYSVTNKENRYTGQRDVALTEIGHPIHTTPALRELGMGIFEGMLFADVERDFKDILEQRREDATVPCPGGESFKDLFERTKAAIDTLLTDEADTVMVVTHAGPCRCIDCMADGGNYADAQSHKLADNASITIFNVENGRLAPALYNLTDHLTDSTTADRKLL